MIVDLIAQGSQMALVLLLAPLLLGYTRKVKARLLLKRGPAAPGLTPSPFCLFSRIIGGLIRPFVEVTRVSVIGLGRAARHVAHRVAHTTTQIGGGFTKTAGSIARGAGNCVRGTGQPFLNAVRSTPRAICRCVGSL